MPSFILILGLQFRILLGRWMVFLSALKIFIITSCLRVGTLCNSFATAIQWRQEFEGTHYFPHVSLRDRSGQKTESQPGYNALHLLCCYYLGRKNLLDIIKFLVNKCGIDPKSKSKNGWDAFLIRCHSYQGKKFLRFFISSFMNIAVAGIIRLMMMMMGLLVLSFQSVKTTAEAI